MGSVVLIVIVHVVKVEVARLMFLSVRFVYKILEVTPRQRKKNAVHHVFDVRRFFIFLRVFSFVIATEKREKTLVRVKIRVNTRFQTKKKSCNRCGYRIYAWWRRRDSNP